MRKATIIAVVFSLMFLSLSPLSHGSGFLIYEHGAAAMAMAGAFVGLANNPTAIFHNPAGIAWLEGTQISLGTTLITAQGSLSLPNWPDPTYKSINRESQWFYPSTFYITHKLSDRISAGFGFFSPYGLGIKWPKDYPLKYIVVSDDMKTFIFNPTISYKLTEDLSLAIGVSYIHSTLSFELVEHADITLITPALPLPVSIQGDVPLTFDASGNSWGLNAGALYKGENFSLGFNWRSGFKIKFEGDLELDPTHIQISPSFLAPFIIIPTEGEASTSFNFPHILGVGAAVDLSESLILTFDVHYVLWSSYDEFIVDVELDPFEDKEVIEKWEDSFLLRCGLQYRLNENVDLRAGFFYDQAPQPVEYMDPILPDADRWGITGGLGYRTGNFILNVAYQFEPFKERTSPNRYIEAYQFLGVNLGEGTYSTTAHLIGISFGYIF